MDDLESCILSMQSRLEQCSLGLIWVIHMLGRLPSCDIIRALHVVDLIFDTLCRVLDKVLVAFSLLLVELLQLVVATKLPGRNHFLWLGTIFKLVSGKPLRWFVYNQAVTWSGWNETPRVNVLNSDLRHLLLHVIRLDQWYRFQTFERLDRSEAAEVIDTEHRSAVLRVSH